MQQLTSLWAGLDRQRRVVAALVVLAVIAAVVALGRIAATPGLSLLYAGLDPAAAGEVVRALDQRGAIYEVRGEAIYVETGARDSLRMTLAGEGLPAVGAAGYELLDGLSGFGTTAQMFDTAYLRAKEGELARTIVASPLIRTARVHIALPQGQPFRRDQRATASVTVATAMGSLPAPQAMALRHLVAASVAGLSPQDVAVIDAAQGLVLAGDDTPPPARAGDERAADLRRNVERLLAARVGPGGAIVEVSVDLVTERESIVERRIEPETRVVISTETEERSNTSSGPAPGVTVASNLPEGDAANGVTSSSSGNEARERVNYEVSELRRELDRSPGDVRRLTVAVLVDGLRGADGAWTPRDPAELADLRELVASVVGFDESRGDVITIKTMELAALAVDAGTLAEASLLSRLDLMALAQLAIAGIVVLALGLFVLRPILIPRAVPRLAPGMGAPPAPVLAPPGAGSGNEMDRAQEGATGIRPPALTGEIDEGFGLPQMALVKDGDAGAAPDDPVERLRRLITKRQAESVEILRNWMEEREEKA